MTLVADERGRQRDLLAGRLSELEIQNKNYQEMIMAYEHAQAHKQRSKRYSTSEKHYYMIYLLQVHVHFI